MEELLIQLIDEVKNINNKLDKIESRIIQIEVNGMMDTLDRFLEKPAAREYALKNPVLRGYALKKIKEYEAL